MAREEMPDREEVLATLKGYHDTAAEVLALASGMRDDRLVMVPVGGLRKLCRIVQQFSEVGMQKFGANGGGHDGA